MYLNDRDWSRIKKGVIQSTEVERVAVEGLYRGGDRIVKELLGRDSVLNAQIEEIIQTGVQALSKRILPLISVDDLVSLLQSALQTHTGFSLIRLGDGELLTLAQGTILTDKEIKKTGGHFLEYAGVSIPDYQARDALEQAVRTADVIGIPLSRRPTYQNLFYKIAQYYGWPLQKMKLTSSLINYEIGNKTPFYRDLLLNHQTLFIGNKMPALKKQLEEDGFQNIVGALELPGTGSIPYVFQHAMHYEFDAVLIAGGVAASILCPQFQTSGKVAIDFGHIADKLLNHSCSL